MDTEKFLTAAKNRLTKSYWIRLSCIVITALLYTLLVALTLYRFSGTFFAWIVMGLGLLACGAYFWKKKIFPPTEEEAARVLDITFELKERAQSYLTARETKSNDRAVVAILESQIQKNLSHFSQEKIPLFSMPKEERYAFFSAPIPLVIILILLSMWPVKVHTSVAGKAIDALIELHPTLPDEVKEDLQKVADALDDPAKDREDVLKELNEAQKEIAEAEASLKESESNGKLAEENISEETEKNADRSPTPSPSPTQTSSSSKEPSPSPSPPPEEKQSSTSQEKKEDQKKGGEGSEKKADQSEKEGGKSEEKGEKGKDQKSDGSGEGEGGQGQGKKDGKGEGQSENEGSPDGKGKGNKGESQGQQQGEGGKKGEKQDGKKEGGEPQGEGSEQAQALNEAKKELQKIKEGLGKNEKQAEAAPGGDKGDSKKGEKGGKEKGGTGKENANDSKDPNSEQEGKNGAASEKGEKPGEEKGKDGKAGKEESSQKPEDPEKGEGVDEKKDNKTDSKDAKGSRSAALPRDTGETKELPDGEGPGRGLGDQPRGFKEAEIKSGDEKYDSRYTEKSGSLTKNTQEAKPKTALSEITRARPEAVSHSEQQPIPLEYKDLIE